MPRLADLAIALPLGLLALPVILVAMLAIRISSPGPAFFSQERVGWREKTFRCHKLRTMYEGTRSVPTHEVGEKAVTPVGRLLRRLKVDELPQLWNVLRGEMSLVGPRPCLLTQKELIDYRREFGLYALRPGITGLAQLRGIDMSNPKSCAEADAEYLGKRSPGMDFEILVMTLIGRKTGIGSAP